MTIPRSLFVVAASMLLSFAASAQAVVSSDFAANVDGWSAPNALSSALNYSATGGNPNGYVSARTPMSFNTGMGTYWYPYYLNAPAKFLGNKSAYYGGGISFDASQTAAAAAYQLNATAVITDLTGVSIYFYPNTQFQPPAFGSWGNFEIPLSAATGEWKTTDAATGPAATAAQINSVLSIINSLQIQGLYANANYITRFDNIILRPPLTVTTQPSSTSACAGQTATFTTLGGNNPTLSYQWQYFIAGLGFINLGNNAVYTNVTTATLSVNTAGGLAAGTYTYRCVISGIGGVVDLPTNTANLTVNALPGAPTTTSAARCGTGSVTLTATGGASYRWYTVSTNGTAIPGQTTGTYATSSLSTTTNYWVAAFNGTCESNRTIVTATINNTTAPTTTDGSRCGTGTVLLTAAGGVNGQYRWYTTPVTGGLIAGQQNSTYTTGSITTSTNYYISIDNGTCESTRTLVVANVNTIPTAPTTTDGSRCGTGTVLLTAAGGVNGQYRWYTTPVTGGLIAGQQNSTYTTGSLTTSTNYYVSIDNGTCESTRTLVVANVNTIPTAPTTTDGSRCGTGTVLLTAAGGVNGQYRWYTTPVTGGLIAGQQNSTYTTGSITTTTNYYVSLDNGTCESTRTLVVANTNTIPTAPTTTGAGRCGTGTVTLTAAGGVNGQYRWYTTPVTGGLIAGQQSSTYTTGSLTTSTNYYVSIDNGTCESTRTLVVATVNTIPTAPTTTGASGCNPASVTLTAAGGVNGQYRWYTTPVTGGLIAGQQNSTYTTGSLTTSTNYYVSIDNGSCESTRTLVAATINNLPTAPTTTGASRCGAGIVTLTAAGGAAGQYRWYTTPVTGGLIAGQQNASYTTASITTTTNYYVSIDNGTCESTRTLVVATINTIPTAPTTTGASRCGNGAVTLTAAGGVAGQYRWYTTPVTGGLIAGQQNATYATPSLTTSTNFYVSIDNGTCESARTLVVVTINTIPTAPTTTGASGCNPSSIILSASGGVNGQYRWYTTPVTGGLIGGQQNSTYTTPSITTTTNYYVSIDNGTCESARTIVVATINNVPSAPGVVNGGGCIPASVTLAANGGTAGQYRWYTVSSGGPAIPGETNDTYTTPVLSSSAIYYVSINNGFCESTRAAVNATLGNPPAAPTVTGGSACSPGIATLTANGAAAGQYRWYTDPTGGTAINGETSSTFNTPELSTTTTYYVSINNGCEGLRTAVVATLNTPPTAPTAIGNFSCVAASITLTASGGSAGQYRWYTTPTGGTAINGEVNSSFATPSITTTTTYYVAITDGTCESPRTAVVAAIGGSSCAGNTPPTIQPAEAETIIGGKITIHLKDLISDNENNLDLSTLTIVKQPSSGATASIDNNVDLVIDYSSRKGFVGTESITISVCDSFGACSEKTFSIEVLPTIKVYNAVSPNNDGKNDLLIIAGIEQFAENHVSIFNRWGDLVWEATGYNNASTVFAGLSKSNAELPPGTYFYKIELPGDSKAETGYLALKR